MPLLKILISKLFSKSVGNGLFANDNFEPGNNIAKFKGEIKNAQDFAAIISLNPDEANYSLQLANGNILCCYQYAKAELCFASYSNSCVNVYRPDSVVKPNASIKHAIETDCDVYLVAVCYIKNNEEIITKYE